MSILNKIKTSSIFFLALIFIVLNSCVMYYNTSEIRNNFKKNIDQFNSIVDKAKNDFPLAKFYRKYNSLPGSSPFLRLLDLGVSSVYPYNAYFLYTSL